MTELIKVNYDANNDKPTVSGRELHEALGINTPYTQWFGRMAEYGFTENEDFWTDHKMLSVLTEQKCHRFSLNIFLQSPWQKKSVCSSAMTRARNFGSILLVLRNNGIAQRQ